MYVGSRKAAEEEAARKAEQERLRKEQERLAAEKTEPAIPSATSSSITIMPSCSLPSLIDTWG